MDMIIVKKGSQGEDAITVMHLGRLGRLGRLDCA
jgi:hypothetical protein